MPVNARDAGNVLRGLESAFDLERGNAGLDQVRQDIDAGKVLRAEQVLAIAQLDFDAVAEQLVGHTTSLSALAAVGGTTAEDFARQALTGVSDTQRAVDEDFEGQRCAIRYTRFGRSKWSLVNGLDLLQRALAGKHHQVAAKLASELNSRRTADRHLRGGMNREVGREPPDQSTNPDILHDGGIHSRSDDGFEIMLRVSQFVLEDEGVERHVAPRAAAVEEGHQIWQVGRREVLGPHSRVELLQAEVDRIGAVLDGRARAFPVAGGCQQLRAAEGANRRRGVGNGDGQVHQRGGQYGGGRAVGQTRKPENWGAGNSGAVPQALEFLSFQPRCHAAASGR